MNDWLLIVARDKELAFGRAATARSSHPCQAYAAGIAFDTDVMATDFEPEEVAIEPIAFGASAMSGQSHSSKTSAGPNLDDFRHIMLQELFDALLERRGGGRATRACTVHGEKDDAPVKAPIDDVAAIPGDRGAYPRLDQILDLIENFGVGRIVFKRLRSGGYRTAGFEQWPATSK